jgi:hypothetical protein
LRWMNMYRPFDTHKTANLVPDAITYNESPFTLKNQ